ncbi:MAG: hypothetical protein U0794_14485 [Isosphaeraceae bacterium]
MMRRSLVLALVLSVSSLAGLARAADKTATGTWTWTVNRNGQDFNSTLKLKQDGDKLTGTYKGGQGEPVEIKEASIKNGELDFKVERERNGNVFTIHYTGKLDGDTIKGKTEMTINGEARSRDWEAKRSAD